MTRHRVGWEQVKTRRSGARFEIGASGDSDAVELEPHANRSGDRLSLYGIIGRLGADAVVYVMSGDAQPMPMREQDQRGRIRTTRKGTVDDGAAGRKVAVR